ILHDTPVQTRTIRLRGSASRYSGECVATPYASESGTRRCEATSPSASAGIQRSSCWTAWSAGSSQVRSLGKARTAARQSLTVAGSVRRRDRIGEPRLGEALLAQEARVAEAAGSAV